MAEDREEMRLLAVMDRAGDHGGRITARRRPRQYLRERAPAGRPGSVLGTRQGRLMDQTFVFTDPWDMEPCGELVSAFRRLCEWQTKRPTGILNGCIC